MPNLPDGYDESTLENRRKIVIEEMKKKKNNLTLVSQMMDQTFPLRRREIVTQEPDVQRWLNDGQHFSLRHR